jgi:hypothetical protein
LDEDQRDNAEAIQAAVLGLFHTAMDEMRWYEFRLSRLRIDLTVCLSASMADAISSAPGYGNNGRRGHPAVDYSGLPPSDTPSQRSEPANCSYWYAPKKTEMSQNPNLGGLGSTRNWDMVSALYSLGSGEELLGLCIAPLLAVHVGKCVEDRD